MSHSSISGIATETPKPESASSSAAEQRVLADRLVALDVDVLVDGGLVDRDQRPPPVLHVVEGAGLDQRLDDPLVADLGGDLGEEVVEVDVAALLLAAEHDAVDDVGADVADRGEAEADVVADRGEVVRRTR